MKNLKSYYVEFLEPNEHAGSRIEIIEMNKNDGIAVEIPYDWNCNNSVQVATEHLKSIGIAIKYVTSCDDFDILHAEI